MAAALDAGPHKQTVWENTYRTEPEEEVRWRQHHVQAVLKELLRERLAGQAYDPVRVSQMTKRLADDIREAVKALGFERHKLLVHVACGEKKQQAFHSSSRSLLDCQTDGCASETFQSETLFCTAQVYGLYFE